MNQIATIPKSVAGQRELVVLPRKEYNELLRTSREAAVKNELDRELAISLEEIRQGKGVGPFDTVDDLMRSLTGRKKKKKTCVLSMLQISAEIL